jgi:hypothetical protein
MRQVLRDSLGSGRGFVRWGDAQVALLVSDANRQALRTGVDITDWLQELATEGWEVGAGGGLLRLDAPGAVYAAVLAARWDGPDPSVWMDARPGLASLCGALLRQPAAQEYTATAKALIRSAWQGLAGDEARALAWADALRPQAATVMRNQARHGLYACGVLLAGYLCTGAGQ